MENIYIYEGHSSQNIFDDDTDKIYTGEELFNASRIKVPNGYRFITFHFNNICTDGNSTGPFILYGLKDITEENINTLFDNKLEESSSTNIRMRNITNFKRIMFRNFVLNYTHFLSSDYESSKTKNFLLPTLPQDHPFKSYDSLVTYINRWSSEIILYILEKYGKTLSDYKNTIEGQLNADENTQLLKKFKKVQFESELFSRISQPNIKTHIGETNNSETSIAIGGLGAIWLIRNKIKDILINTLCNKDNTIKSEYKNIGEIYQIISNRKLLDLFYKEFLFLLIGQENIDNIVMTNNILHIYNYLMTGKFISPQETIAPSHNIWSMHTKKRIDLKEKLQNTIQFFDINIIDAICKYFKFTIRSYETGILTPILSFHDELSYCVYINTKDKCTNEIEDRSKEYHNYKYGFYPLEDYKQIKELPHKIIKYEKPERNIENGLSNYSSENNIPSQLFLYDIEYKYNEEVYGMIKYYFNFTYKLFGLNETFIFDIKEFFDETPTKTFLKDHIYLTISSMCDNDEADIFNIIEELYDEISHLYDKNKDVLQSEYPTIDIFFASYIYDDEIKLYNIKNNQINLLYFLIYLYKFLFLCNQLLHLNLDSHDENFGINIIYYLRSIIIFYDKVTTNFFNHLQPGTYIITGCGSYSSKLKKNVENLNDKTCEKEQFDDRTKYYDINWKKKYLKYKQKYIELKKLK